MHIHDNEDYLVINMKTWYNNYFTQNGLIFQHNCPQVNEFKQLVREHVVSIINEFGKEEGRAKPIHRKDILTEKKRPYIGPNYLISKFCSNPPQGNTEGRNTQEMRMKYHQIIK